MGIVRRAGVAAAAIVAPLGLAYRFALTYRARAGFPRGHSPLITPSGVGLAFQTAIIQSDGLALPAWFMPARGGLPGPGVVLVHGWESARDRTLPMAIFLHAAGFHCLTFDVRGHGANPPEALPISAGEFGRDAAAAFDALIARPEVTVGAIVGHSLGGIGALLAGAADPRVSAVVATSGPSDPYRLTRQTFRLAHLPIPNLIAQPLARLTTWVYLRPRGHRVQDISASKAIERYDGPVLLAHGDQDAIVPISHMAQLALVGRRSRARDPRKGLVETLIVAGGQHSWLYEDPGYRRTVARMLTRSLGGPLDPETAGEIAAATRAVRIPDAEIPFAAVDGSQRGLRAIAEVATPGSTSFPATPAPGPLHEPAPGPEVGTARVPLPAEG